MTQAATGARMIVIAAIVQNVTTGLLFGSFGTMLYALEDRFGADRGQSSLTLSLAVVSLSLVAAWLGSRIGRQALRPLMLVGSALSAMGFAVLTQVTATWQLWAVYLLLLGPGAGLAGVLATNALASAWAPDCLRGRALGWVNAPLLVTLAPLAAAFVLQRFGLDALFACLAVCHLAMLPLIALIREPQWAQGQAGAHGGPGRSARGGWLLLGLVFVIGVISGGGLLKMSHLIPLVTAQGHSFERANMLLAISGGAGIAGSLVFGWLCDRIGPGVSLALNAILQAGMWFILLVPVHYALLVVDAVVVGICGGGLQTVVATLLVRIYGEEAFGRIFGLLSLLTLPFLFGLPWLAGVLYVHSGGYLLPIALQIAGFVLAGVGAVLIARRERIA